MDRIRIGVILDPVQLPADLESNSVNDFVIILLQLMEAEIVKEHPLRSKVVNKPSVQVNSLWAYVHELL